MKHRVATRRLGRASALVAAISLLSVACSGTSGGPSTSMPQPVTTSAPPATTTSTTLPPTTTSTTEPPRFDTVTGTAPDALGSYEAEILVTTTIAGATIQLSGSGTYTTEAFSCEWGFDVLEATGSVSVVGSPRAVWIDDGSGQVEVGPSSNEAINALSLCPSSPAFWAGYEPDGDPTAGEIEEKNGVEAIRADLTGITGGLPGVSFAQLDGVTVDRALVWFAEPDGWVSAIELVMIVEPEAASDLWGVPFDADVGQSVMSFVVNILNPDDPGLVVVLPEPTDPAVALGTIVVEGAPLPQYQSGGVDGAVQKVAPSISGADWDGTPHRIAADGRPKIVIFLAHWCPHCKAEVPVVTRWISEGNLPSEVDVYSVTTFNDNLRPNWPPQAWLVSEGWPVPVLMDDEESAAAGAFGVGGVPFYVVVDGDNRVLVRVSGELDVAGLDALAQIASGS